MRFVWLISFADLMALMMSFFLMLYAVANTNKPPQTQTQHSGAVGRGVTEHAGDKDAQTPPRRDAAMARSLPYVQGLLQAAIYNAGIGDLVNLVPGKDGQRLIIQVKGDMLFQSSQASLQANGRDVLLQLAPVLARLNNAIEVLGHTDDTQVRAGQYKDNWDLSLARAAAVAQVLQQGGVTRTIVMRGFADGTMADMPAGAAATNARRVDIIINARDLTTTRAATGLRIIP